MKLRSVAFPKVDAANVLKALSLMGYPATLKRHHAAVSSWLTSSSLLDRVTVILSAAHQQGMLQIPPGYAWTQLSAADYASASAIAAHFSFENVVPDDIDEAIEYARETIAGDDSVLEIFADPFIFLSTLRRENLAVTVLLEALSLVRLVIAAGGEVVWNRSAVHEKLDVPRIRVIWSDGSFRLPRARFSQLQARRREKAHYGRARVLVEGKTGSGEWERFVATSDVAQASMWAGVTVREVRLAVLAELMLPGRDERREDYVDSQGADLADVVGVGALTCVHSVHGFSVMMGTRVLQWPSLREAVTGYAYRCEWGLGRGVGPGDAGCGKYHYVRGQYDQQKRDWQFEVNTETYTSEYSLLRRTRSICEFGVFRTQVALGMKHAIPNARDARIRARKRGRFVSTREETTSKPTVGDVMLRALSDRIDVYEPVDSFEKCFGEENPSGSPVRDDEQVVVLSYRHQSPTTRMTPAQWEHCFADLCEVARIHGKTALRVWTDKLSSNTRGDAGWVESGVEPYRSAPVVAFNGTGDSVLVDRFWLGLERAIGFRAWGYWVRDDLGNMTRLADNAYPALLEDESFLTQILFSTDRADGGLWEADRKAVLADAAQQLGITNRDELWEALTGEFLPRRFIEIEVVEQRRGQPRRAQRWCAADAIVDRGLLEASLDVDVMERMQFVQKKWYEGSEDHLRLAAVKSQVSEHWFCCLVEVVVRGKPAKGDMAQAMVVDVYGRRTLQTAELMDVTENMVVCAEEWI